MARLDYAPRGGQLRGARRKTGWHGSLRLGALFTLLVGINVYVFFFRGGTSIHDVLKTQALSKRTALHGGRAGARQETRQRRPAETSTDDSIIVQGSMKGHIGLSSALATLNIDGGQTTELVAALRPELDMRSLRPRHTFEARIDPHTKRIRTFSFKLSRIDTVVVSRNAQGVLKARRAVEQLDTRTVRVGGRVRSSLNGAMTRAGEGSALVSTFVDLFSWDVNWYSDPREGDEFRIVVEKKYRGSEFYQYGHILAAEYRGKVGRFQAFYFKPQGGTGGYYTPEGRSISREFLKTPLNFRRISSKFNKNRSHPVLHRTRGHFGVDYAAPRGTPVWAVADGKVTSVGRSGEAGNMVIVQHAHGRTTLYMHLSRFASGIKQGSSVKQRQVIGFVGSTGLATGPHLHYGIKVNGRHVDPLRFGVGKGLMLSRVQRIRFLDELPQRMATLESMPVADEGESK